MGVGVCVCVVHVEVLVNVHRAETVYYERRTVRRKWTSLKRFPLRCSQVVSSTTRLWWWKGQTTTSSLRLRG